MSFTFAPAVRTNTPMIIGIAGPSGSGKTYTAISLAMGLVGVDPHDESTWPGKIAFGDTEGGRGKHYAPAPGQKPDFINTFPFAHTDIASPYAPKRFLELLQDAAKAGYQVIIVDSFSDEYAGEGGLVDMAAASKVANEAAKWAKPKAEHKLVVRWLRQSRCHLIFCLRAEEKVRLATIDSEGREVMVPAFRPDVPGYTRAPGLKTVVVPIGWQPICEKNVPYEMATSFMLTPEAPGVPRPIKIKEQHRAFFPTDKPITAETGRQLAAWCAGGAPIIHARAPTEPADDDLVGEAWRAADEGTDALSAFWRGLRGTHQRMLCRDMGYDPNDGCPLRLKDHAADRDQLRELAGETA